MKKKVFRRSNLPPVLDGAQLSRSFSQQSGRSTFEPEHLLHLPHPQPQSLMPLRLLPIRCANAAAMTSAIKAARAKLMAFIPEPSRFLC
jgi:hypothetical protein